MKRRKIVEIFWTGGYDSTFRIVELSRKKIDIQPYYISDNRQSEKEELNAINKITDLLKKHEDTKANFLDIIIIQKKARKEDEQITQIYNKLRKKEFFGSQYNWLASFALEHKGIELSVHQDDKAILLIEKYGKLKKITDETLGEYYIVDKSKTSQDVYELFGNYHLPLATITKLEMKKFYTENNYKEIMDLTWFCHTPINGEACGICNPCIYTIEEGMKERLSSKALFRNKYKLIFKAIAKLKNIIKKITKKNK